MLSTTDRRRCSVVCRCCFFLSRFSLPLCPVLYCERQDEFWGELMLFVHVCEVNMLLMMMWTSQTSSPHAIFRHKLFLRSRTFYNPTMSTPCGLRRTTVVVLLLLLLVPAASPIRVSLPKSFEALSKPRDTTNFLEAARLSAESTMRNLERIEDATMLARTALTLARSANDRAVRAERLVITLAVMLLAAGTMMWWHLRQSRNVSPSPRLNQQVRKRGK